MSQPCRVCSPYLRQAGALVLLLAMLVWTGCRQNTPTPPPPGEILRRSAARMQALGSFRFAIDRQGDPAYLDAGQTLSFRRMEGYFIAPDRAWATVRVIAPGLVAEVQAISIGQEYWETQLLTNEWQRLEAGQGFNPAVLFDLQAGFPPILQEDLVELEMIGVESLEDLPGGSFYSLKGRLAGKRIFELSYGLIGPDPIETRVWIQPDTFELARVFLFEPAEEGEGTTWQVDFWDYNQELRIEPPPEAIPLP